MSQFLLEIITPEKRFHDGMVESLVIDTPEGKRGVLAGHTPMLVAMSVGNISFKVDGQWKKAVASDGFVEVRPDKTIINAQTVEWPEEAEERKAEEARSRADDHLRQEQSLREFNDSMTSIARTMVALKVKRSINHD